MNDEKKVCFVSWFIVGTSRIFCRYICFNFPICVYIRTSSAMRWYSLGSYIGIPLITYFIWVLCHDHFVAFYTCLASVYLQCMFVDVLFGVPIHYFNYISFAQLIWECSSRPLLFFWLWCNFLSPRYAEFLNIWE